MMSDTPLVTVIMIFFNAEKFMVEAISSVRGQTYQNWELLLVDDGSSDGSPVLAQEQAQQCPEKIHYLHHSGRENRGMSATRNLGLQAARGELIAFLDADDVYLPEKLERQVALLRAQPQAAMVYGATTHWFSWTGQAEDQGLDFRRKLGVPVDSLVHPPEMVTRFMRHEAWTPGTCGVLVRREVFDRIGGFEESFRGMLEDQVFFYKLCLHFPVYVESGSWDLYRQHPDSGYWVARREGKIDARRPNPSHAAFLQWLETYLIHEGVTDSALWSAFRREIWPYRHPWLWKLKDILQRIRAAV